MSRIQQRAATLIAPRTMRMRDADAPQPGPDEVRVQLQGCGICASSLPLWEGRPWFDYPRLAGAPGHEGWGTVDALGSSVQDLALGERVALVSANAYAELDVAPRRAVVRLPGEFASLPFPGEPLGCAMNIFERSDVRAGQTVAIVGAGFLGILLAQLATKARAEVVVISRREHALRLAAATGAAQVRADSHAAAIECALQLTEGRGYNRVIETGGVQATLDIAGAIAAEYGRLIVAGYHQDGLRTVNMQQWNWQALDVVNAHERSLERYAAGMERAIAAILDGRIDPFPLLTHEVTLDTLDDGFAFASTRPDGFMKAWARVAA